MKQIETFQNRVAQFNLDQKKTATPTAAPVVSVPVDSQNPYLKARIKVLSGYKEDRRIELAVMERDGDINNRFYDAFLFDVLVTAGDSPSLALRNRIKGIS